MKLDIMPRDMFAEKESGSLFENGPEDVTTTTSTEMTPETEEANSSEIAAEESMNSTTEKYDGFDNNFTKPTDYSWIARVDVDDDLLNKKIEKSNVEPTDISREYADAWNYADPFNPLREKETLRDRWSDEFGIDYDAYEEQRKEGTGQMLKPVPKSGVEKSEDRREELQMKRISPQPSSVRGKLENLAKEAPMYASTDLDKIFETNSEKMGQEIQEWTKKQFTDEEWAERQKERAEKEKWNDYRKDFIKRLDDLTRTKDPDEEGPAEYDWDRLHSIEDDWEPLKEEMKAHPDFEKDVYEHYWDSLKKGVYDGYSKLEKAAKNSPMYAKAGISTELNNPNHEETLSEAMKNEAIPYATSKELESGWKDTSKPGNTKEELAAAQKEFDKNKELFTPEQKRAIANFDPNRGTTITDLAHALTLGIAPTINKINDFDKIEYSSFIERKAKEYGDAGRAIREVNKLIEGSQMGLAKEGIEYWKETGQTLGNKYAEKAEQTIVDALVAYENGQITEDQMNSLVESVINPSNTDQLMSLFKSPALTGLEAMAAGAAIGTAAAKIVEKGAPVIFNKLMQSNSKIGQKIVEKIATSKTVQNRYKYDTLLQAFNDAPYAEQAVADVSDWGRKLAQAIADGDKAATKRLMNSRKFADNLDRIFGKEPAKLSIHEDIMFDLVNKGMDDIAKDWARDVLSGGTYRSSQELKEMTDVITQLRTNPAEYADWFTAMSRDLGYARPVDMAKAITDAIAENKSVKKGLTAAGITVASVEKAQATPTGIFSDKGKMVDSKEIVEERKDRPYEGEDAVTLYTREGKVTVTPREAVIIGEAENLPPTSGYTDKVKDVAKGSEVYEQPEVQMIQPTDEQIGFWQKAGDVVQVILGGRDLNNDKTITKSEWYESTIGKVVNKFKDIFSGSDDNIDKVGEKSVWQKIKDKFSSTLDSVGKSVPGVVDLKNGTAYINPALDRPNLDLSPEAIRSTVETAVVDSLPNWSDNAGLELKKNIASTVVSETLASNVFGNFGVITAAKIVGQYVTDTVSEIAHLYGKDLDNDEKGAINFIATNTIGLPLVPVSTIARDVGASFYGVATRHDIEKVFENGSNVSSEFYIIPYKGGIYPQKSSYGASSTGRASAEGKYSGYREQAINRNIATDYNEGLEQETNEAVSDKHKKLFITMLENEPDYIRKVLMDIPKRRGF